MASPNRVAEPPFYDDLDLSLAQAWAMLVDGAANRRAGFRTATLATVRAGLPRARTVVLRAADPRARELRVHTDLRSPKADEIRAFPRAQLVFYDAEAKVQLRIDGSCCLRIDDRYADEAWASSRPMSRACYRAPHPPGALLASPDLGLTGPEGQDAGRGNFAAIRIEVLELEWLYLAHAGHRRARYAWDGDGAPRGEWLAP